MKLIGRQSAAILGVICLALLAAGCAGQGQTIPERHPRGDQTPEQQGDEWAKWDQRGTYELRGTLGGYFQSRLYDFLDIFDVSLCAGKWARIEAQYAIGFYGFGAQDVQRIRFGGRSFLLGEESTTVSTLPFPASLILFPSLWASDNRPAATIATLGGVSDEVEFAHWPEPVFVNIPKVRERVRITGIERDVAEHRFVVTADSFPVGAEAHLFLGARVRVMPLQSLDFLAGIFGWDPAGDDIHPYRPTLGGETVPAIK